MGASCCSLTFSKAQYLFVRQCGCLKIVIAVAQGTQTLCRYKQRLRQQRVNTSAPSASRFVALVTTPARTAVGHFLSRLQSCTTALSSYMLRHLNPATDAERAHKHRPRTCRPHLTEDTFHELADDTLHRLQDKLDAYVEDKLEEGDVSFEVRKCLRYQLSP